jgi:HEAT repeat protein
VRIATTWALEMTDAPRAVEALVKCLSDEDPAVVVECIRSLEFLGDETTVEYLIPMLSHEDEDVRSAAADAIKSLQ